MTQPADSPKHVDIADLRRRLGGADGPISQSALARMIGTSQPHVCRLENDPAQQKGPLAILLRKLDAETPEPERGKAA